MISTRSNIIKSLLGFYFLHEKQSFHVNDIVRRLGADKRNLVKKLRELEDEKILISEPRGNQRCYFLNKEYPLYKEYKNIFMKTSGIEEKLRLALSKVSGVREAYIYGSYARGGMDEFSDIDIIIIGNHDTILVQKEISKLQKGIDREINAISIGPEEFSDKKEKGDPFISGIFKEKHIKII